MQEETKDCTMFFYLHFLSFKSWNISPTWYYNVILGYSIKNYLLLGDLEVLWEMSQKYFGAKQITTII